MPAGPSTLADRRKAGFITSQEIVAAIDAYTRARYNREKIDPGVEAERLLRAS